MERETLDPHLWALLGNRETVRAWWNNPNAHWQGRTPESVYETDPDSVTQYVMTHCYGGSYG
jgi:hypothetical protein